MFREALVCVIALTLLGGCDRPDWEQQTPPAPVTTPAPQLVHPLGDFLPLAIRLDCSELGDGERPASVYVTIRTPQVRPIEQTLMARVESDTLCETHDIANNAAAPALAIRCPPRQIMEYDTGRHDCTHHDIEINVCSPGFVSHSEHWMDFSSCGTGREQPSCASLSAGDATSYPYVPVVYKLTPKPEGSGASCGDAPTTLLADDPTLACSCFEE